MYICSGRLFFSQLGRPWYPSSAPDAFQGWTNLKLGTSFSNLQLGCAVRPVLRCWRGVRRMFQKEKLTLAGVWWSPVCHGECSTCTAACALLRDGWVLSSHYLGGKERRNFPGGPSPPPRVGMGLRWGHSSLTTLPTFCWALLHLFPASTVFYSFIEL